FWNAAQCDILYFTDHFQFTKRTALSISPCLAGKDDRLRIPVKHDHGTKLICEKKTDDTVNWKQRHYKTIRHTYASYPFAYFYLPVLDEFFKNNNMMLSSFVIDLNRLLIRFLSLNLTTYNASERPYDLNNDETIISWCKKNNTDVYINAHQIFENGWLNESALETAGLKTKHFSNFPEYNIFQNYRSYSILKFIFQYGPEAGYMIKQYLPLKHT
ncbi:MAG: WbqC family protein, partial [Calditrichaceae bacterium]